MTGLADGSLSAEDRARAARAVARAPRLQQGLDSQRRALRALERVRVEGAPPGLRARLTLARAPEARPSRRRGARPALALGALASAAAVVTLLALSGASGGVTVAQAAALGSRPIQSALGPPAAARTALPYPRLDGLSFPYWRETLGLDPVGSRRDRLGGRTAVTVFYRGRGGRVGYTIVSGPPLPLGTRASTTSAGGVTVRVTELNGRTVLSWLRDGHTCVLTGTAGAARLVPLVAFRRGGLGGY